MTIPSNPTKVVCSRTRYTRERRDRLLKEHNNQCARCHATENLEMDCRDPVGGEHHDMSWFQRIRFYELQNMVGNLQILCRDCHQIKTFSDIRNGVYDSHPNLKRQLLEKETNA